MKKFIKKVVLFLLLFLILNVLYLGILLITDWGLKKRVESLTFNDPKYELLVIGNSLAFDGIDTELITQYGINAYNLALGGSSLKTNYIQLQEYLKRYDYKPKYVVLGMGSYMGCFDGEDIHPIVEVTSSGYNYSLKDIPLVKFQWLAKGLAKKTISTPHRKAKLIKGQLKFNKTIQDTTSFNEEEFDPDYYAKSKYVSELANLCESYDIEFLILEMPGYAENRNVNDIGPYELIFGKGAEAMLLNFNNYAFCSIFDPTSDWIGNSHLNEYGAKKFTTELIRIIFERIEPNFSNFYNIEAEIIEPLNE